MIIKHVRNGILCNFSKIDIAWFLIRLPFVRFIKPYRGYSFLTKEDIDIYVDGQMKIDNRYRHVVNPISKIIDYILGIVPQYDSHGRFERYQEIEEYKIHLQIEARRALKANIELQNKKKDKQ